MRVNFRRADEEEGFLRKKRLYALYVRVELTPEEVAAVEAANVGNYIIVKYGFEMFGSYVPTNYDIKMVLYGNKKGNEFRFVAPDAIKRNELEREIKEGLAGLARLIESSSPKEVESFEFDTGRGSPTPRVSSAGRFCTSCGSAAPLHEARFCTKCGQQLQ